MCPNRDLQQDANIKTSRGYQQIRWQTCLHLVSEGANGLMRRWEKQFCRAVLESGTGSGSLTHALARAVGPGGDVHTFEFHALRTAAAEAEFQSHNLGNLVHIQQRDIEGLGFPEQLHGMADAVFLDLPGPWKVSPDCYSLIHTAISAKNC